MHKYKLMCESCGEILDPLNLEIILKSVNWPESPVSVNYLFSKKLFVLWDLIRKHMPGSSETAFLMTLQDVSLKNGCARKFTALLF